MIAPLTLTILGAGPAAPNPGGACSGYLLRQREAAVLMDCGSGISGRIAAHVPPNQLSAVVISHFHPDHYFDLIPLYYILKFGEARPALPSHMPLYVPPGGREFLRRFGEMISSNETILEDIFEICEYAADREVDIGGLQFGFHRVQHYVPSHAMRVRTDSGAVLTFSSDVGPCRTLTEAARDADLFMCESALLDASQDEHDPARRGHMSAAEAGAVAREAGARRLLITHYRGGQKNEAHHLAGASHAFAGPVELAREGKTYVVTAD